jgi:hypothetical protein
MIVRTALIDAPWLFCYSVWVPVPYIIRIGDARLRSDRAVVEAVAWIALPPLCVGASVCGSL